MRVEPLAPPYEPAVADMLGRMMPPGVDPIGLFRTFAKNEPMTRALMGWGGYELSADLSLTLRDREIVIDRICVRCSCEYEWGVHVVFFAEAAGLDVEQIRSLTHGDASDPCWRTERDRLLIEAADALHDSSTWSDGLYQRLAAEFTEAELLDLLLLSGWYHAISFAANGAGVALEPGSPVFADYR
ncbi:MAG: carboxymuconolactone decarboxylase family protein [Actinomycetota bacterium]